MSRVLATPPCWARPSFANSLAAADGPATSGPGGIGLASIPSTLTAALSLSALLAVLIGCGIGTRARAPAARVLGLAWFTASKIPIAVYGVGARAAMAPADRRFHRVRDPRDRHRARDAPPTTSPHDIDRHGCGVPHIRRGRAQSPRIQRSVGPSFSRWAVPVTGDLNDQLTRRYDGTNARARMFFRFGDAALETSEGARRVALHVELEPAEQERLEQLRDAGARNTEVEELALRWGRETVAIFVEPITRGSPR